MSPSSGKNISDGLNSDSFRELSRTTRLRLLAMHYHAGVGHIGGNLSSIDTMLYVHHCLMKPEDVFILSKGHAAGALYVTLWTLGVLSDEDLDTFHADASHLPGHPPPGYFKDIPISTGSLGHGFPVASGIALARKLLQKSGQVFCLCSDGEWQAGSNWEALIFSRHHNLTNLVLLVDMNGLQGFGTTSATASLNDLKRHFETFDLEVVELNGHSFDSLKEMNALPNGKRAVYLLNTVKGKGVSFMEDRLEWHYLPLTIDLYQKAVRELRE
jgi:transketolase